MPIDGATPQKPVTGPESVSKENQETASTENQTPDPLGAIILKSLSEGSFESAPGLEDRAVTTVGTSGPSGTKRSTSLAEKNLANSEADTAIDEEAEKEQISENLEDAGLKKGHDGNVSADTIAGT